MKKQFGGKLTDRLISRYKKSPQWRNGKFMNAEETTMNINWQSLPKLLYKQFFETRGREPKAPIPITPFDKEAFLRSENKTQLIWYGHSVVLMRLNGKTLLIDPMLGPDAAPIAPFKSKRFSENTLDLIDQFPEIDLMLLTHDHYDHLDLASIEKFKPKVKNYYVALGCARHLESWGIDHQLVKEFDWWDKANFEGIEITFTPTRHFSGRGLKDRAKSLWGGWAFINGEERIYFSGDGGYGKHFKEIGEKLGPFNFGLMECGQYNENWHQIHMYPEEAIQAAIDAGVSKVMAVHWAGFSLAQHSWKEPIEKFVKAAQQKQINFSTPLPGQMINWQEEIQPMWWSKMT
ncbi:MBL fold metallo-hydrolase [Roseivirga sp.]|uniref:MBL fold metallo-hydrolase n=1 Tax=Roseivirga sp. TaxID=1964215 RepID=UPI003B51F736